MSLISWIKNLFKGSTTTTKTDEDVGLVAPYKVEPPLRVEDAVMGAPIVDWPFPIRAQPAATKKGAHEGNKAPAAKKAPVKKPAVRKPRAPKV